MDKGICVTIFVSYMGKGICVRMFRSCTDKIFVLGFSVVVCVKEFFVGTFGGCMGKGICVLGRAEGVWIKEFELGCSVCVWIKEFLLGSSVDMGC